MAKDLIGQQLGNYRLVSLLGRGGFAEVYLGQHVRLSMQAAIKVLHAHLSDEQIQGFQQEAETIAKLVHPHIVRVLDFDVSDDGIPFLVMDYCPNGTLRKQHVRGERVSLLTVVSYVQQIADALQYAHDQKLIHRDIKPENMLIGQRNDLLLSDFGIASTAHSTSSMSTQIPVGTIPYMAPEQIQAQARPASDQYALGIVVYEWLCGERPFEGSYTEIFAKHLMTPPAPLHLKVPTILPDVEQVILTALAKDPHQRFATVQAFATALEQASQTVQPVRGLTPSHPKPPQLELPLPSTAIAPHVMQVATQPEMDTPVEQVQLPKQNPSRPSQVSAKPQPSKANPSRPSQIQVTHQPAKPNQSLSSYMAAAAIIAAAVAAIITISRGMAGPGALAGVVAGAVVAVSVGLAGGVVARTETRVAGTAGLVVGMVLAVAGIVVLVIVAKALVTAAGVAAVLVGGVDGALLEIGAEIGAIVGLIVGVMSGLVYHSRNKKR